MLLSTSFTLQTISSPEEQLKDTKTPKAKSIVAIFQSLPVSKTLTNQIVKVFVFNTSGGEKGTWDGMFSAAEVQAEVKKTVHLSSL